MIIKEFCNLVGGSISSLAKKEQNELGKSIPMVLTGFDEIYFPVNKILSEMVYEWEFTKGHIKPIKNPSAYVCSDGFPWFLNS